MFWLPPPLPKHSSWDSDRGSGQPSHFISPSFPHLIMCHLYTSISIYLYIHTHTYKTMLSCLPPKSLTSKIKHILVQVPWQSPDQELFWASTSWSFDAEKGHLSRPSDVDLVWLAGQCAQKPQPQHPHCPRARRPLRIPRSFLWDWPYPHLWLEP